MRAQNPNHWTTKEFPFFFLFKAHTEAHLQSETLSHLPRSSSWAAFLPSSVLSGVNPFHTLLWFVPGCQTYHTHHVHFGILLKVKKTCWTKAGRVTKRRNHILDAISSFQSYFLLGKDPQHRSALPSWGKARLQRLSTPVSSYWSPSIDVLKPCCAEVALAELAKTHCRPPPPTSRDWCFSRSGWGWGRIIISFFSFFFFFLLAALHAGF